MSNLTPKQILDIMSNLTPQQIFEISQLLGPCQISITLHNTLTILNNPPKSL